MDPKFVNRHKQILERLQTINTQITTLYPDHQKGNNNRQYAQFMDEFKTLHIERMEIEKNYPEIKKMRKYRTI